MRKRVSLLDEEFSLAYGVEDAAKQIGLGETSMKKLVTSGQVRSIKILGRRIIRRKALERFLDQLELEQYGELEPVEQSA